MWLVVIRMSEFLGILVAHTFSVSEGEDVLASLRECFGVDGIEHVYSFATKKKAYKFAEDFNLNR